MTLSHFTCVFMYVKMIAFLTLFKEIDKILN